MNAISMNNLWNYLQGLSLTASNRKWLAERLVEAESKPVMTDKEIKEGLKSAFTQLKEVKEGYRVTRNAEDLLYEL
ncbi:MAG: surface protein [Prevotella sp.]|nr:surface protein [Prevotella sp.]